MTDLLCLYIQFCIPSFRLHFRYRYLLCTIITINSTACMYNIITSRDLELDPDFPQAGATHSLHMLQSFHSTIQIQTNCWQGVVYLTAFLSIAFSGLECTSHSSASAGSTFSTSTGIATSTLFSTFSPFTPFGQFITRLFIAWNTFICWLISTFAESRITGTWTLF